MKPNPFGAARKIAVLAAAFFLLCAPALSQDEENSDEDQVEIPLKNPSAPIREIRISGLKRTRDSYMQEVLAKYKDVPAGQLDLHELENELRRQNLFSEIAINIEENGPDSYDLKIDVTEKLSFIPLPFASYSNGKGAAGLFVMDTNAFGVKDSVVVGGMYTSDAKMAFAMFEKPSLGLTRPGFMLSGSFSKSRNKLCDLKEPDTILLEYDSLSARGSAAIVTKLCDWAKFTLGASYAYGKIYDEDKFDKLESAQVFSLTGGLGASASDWNGWFMSALSAGVNAKASLDDGREKSFAAQVALGLEKPVFHPRLRLISSAGGAYGWHLHQFELFGGGSVRVSILPDEFRTERLAGASAGLEYAMARFSWGTLSAYGQYECAAVQDYDEDLELSQGWSSGVKLYLSKVAFPALSIGIAQNVTYREFMYSIALGISM